MRNGLITEIDNLETNRVKAARAKQLGAWHILVAVLVTVYILLLQFKVLSQLNDQNYVISVWVGLVVIYLIGVMGIYNKFREILRIAQMNDRIRHEEKVRYAERSKHELEKEIERLERELNALREEKRNNPDFID